MDDGGYENHYWEPEKRKWRCAKGYPVAIPLVRIRKHLMIDKEAKETPEEYLIRMAPITYILYRCPEERTNHPAICDLTDMEVEDFKIYIRSVIAAPLWNEVQRRAIKKGMPYDSDELGGILDFVIPLVERNLYKFNNPAQNHGRRVQNFHYFVQFDVRMAFKKNVLANEAISEHELGIRKTIERCRQQAMLLFGTDYEKVTEDAIYDLQPQRKRKKDMMSKKVIRERLEGEARLVEMTPEIANTLMENDERDPFAHIWKYRNEEIIKELLLVLKPVDRFIFLYFQNLDEKEFIEWLLRSPGFYEVCWQDGDIRRYMKRNIKRGKSVMTSNFVRRRVTETMTIVREFMEAHDLNAQDMEGVIGKFICRDKNEDGE
ncbi:MAG: hypothetical protein K6E75_13250 [Lachnospiraceae bacterium]|nr:hypothetical protein [Lachnospiraceae bacterium]